jgi:hypothetical protein
MKDEKRKKVEENLFTFHRLFIDLGQGSATCGSQATCGSLDVKLRLFSSIRKYYLKKKKHLKIVLNRLRVVTVVSPSEALE